MAGKLALPPELVRDPSVVGIEGPDVPAPVVGIEGPDVPAPVVGIEGPDVPAPSGRLASVDRSRALVPNCAGLRVGNRQLDGEFTPELPCDPCGE